MNKKGKSFRLTCRIELVDMCNAAFVRYRNLVIEDGRVHRQLTEPRGYGRKPLRRVVARPAPEAHYATLNRGDDPVAVMFDFVDPAGTGRRFIYRAAELWRDVAVATAFQVRCAR